MSRIFITGSADGLGQLAAKQLIVQGNKVVLHARNEKRAREALTQLPGAEAVLIGDLSNIEETIQLASKVNGLGRFDAIIHNAGLYNASPKDLLSVNTLAPYILTSLVHKPKRLIYLCSDMYEGGNPKLESLRTDVSRINYSDTKFHVLLLCKAVARKWPGIYTNAVNPGWVPTKMGGTGAPDDLRKGYETQVALAVSNDEKVKASGRLFYHQKEVPTSSKFDDVRLQDDFLTVCKDITGIAHP
jgi:NAD(P)-dependent dehydrogenase (short-subunit alcohol dehydrogenase family)